VQPTAWDLKPLTLDARRLLGFAFAAGDLLLEIDEHHNVALALGASKALLGENEPTLTGRPWKTLVAPADHALFEAVLAGLGSGARGGPVLVDLASGKSANISFRRLSANNDRVSCSLVGAARGREASAADGLFSQTEFSEVTAGLLDLARMSGAELELAMVEMSGLDQAREGLNPEQSADLDARVAGALRAESHAGSAAARLADNRFAMVRNKEGDPAELAHRISRAVSLAAGGTAVQAAAHAVPLSPRDSNSRMMRAVRYALDDFVSEGLKAAPSLSLTEAMNQSVRRTLAQAGELGVAVSQRRFALHFQPVVDLKTGEAHHHEVLVRFENGGSPFSMIRLAEEFDLIEELDNAIVEQSIRYLRDDRDKTLKLAVNVSGRTITSEAFVSRVAGLLQQSKPAQGRLIFEITESAAIDDLALADRHIQALRGMDCLVCLDDFGAGSASMAYLQALNLDIVKIDGRYVRELADSGRDGALVRHLVKLCAELKIRTVAEMVETVEIEDVIRAAGVNFAQGWLYGRPADRPEKPKKVTPLKPMLGKRMGERETWG
jgi:EAL domain-containing protein (putative c-di-GMP-specific phosphodiesterase class I)